MKTTIIIPAFNRPEFLQRAIESILNQSDTNFELIVVDDHSTDPRIPEIREIFQKSAIQWITNPENLGPAASRNRGVSAGSGEWIAFLDSDDRWFSEKLARQHHFHETHPDIRISQCQENWIRAGKPVKKPKHLAQPETGHIFEESTKRCCISPSAVMIRRDLWNKTGGFDESFRLCEDYELWLRITKSEPVGLIPGTDLVEKFGGHPDQLTNNVEGGIDQWRVKALQKIIATGIDNPDYLVAANEALSEKIRIAEKQKARLK